MSVNLVAVNLNSLRKITTIIFFSFLVIPLGIAQSIARPDDHNQEETELFTDLSTELSTDNTLITDPENDKELNVEVVKKDSTEEKSSEIKVSEKENKPSDVDVVDEQEESTSIISFNFIFYILQKFKFSDILGGVAN